MPCVSDAVVIVVFPHFVGALSPQADLGFPYPSADLDVFTGTSVSSLTAITTSSACPTRVSGGYHSCATFNGTAGTTYFLRVDGPDAMVGPATVQVDIAPYCAPGQGHLHDLANETCTVCPVGRQGPDLSNGCAPVNDNFAAATPVLNGVTYNGTTEGGTWEVWEPAASGAGTLTSVWYKFDALSGGNVTVSMWVWMRGYVGVFRASWYTMLSRTPWGTMGTHFLPCAPRAVAPCRSRRGTGLGMAWWTCSLAPRRRRWRGWRAHGMVATRRL